jgi:hypothetical protein
MSPPPGASGGHLSGMTCRHVHRAIAVRSSLDSPPEISNGYNAGLSPDQNVGGSSKTDIRLSPEPPSFILFPVGTPWSRA